MTIDPNRPGATLSPQSIKPRTIFPTPKPFDQWPIWAKALKHFSNDADKGIGDTVARMIGDEKSEAFKVWFESTFKQKCGCAGRQIRWNIEFPL